MWEASPDFEQIRACGIAKIMKSNKEREIRTQFGEPRAEFELETISETAGNHLNKMGRVSPENQRKNYEFWILLEKQSKNQTN